MKTRILAILFVAASVLVSCSKTEFSSGKNDSGTVPVEFCFNVDTLDQTKGYFTGFGRERMFNFTSFDTIYAKPFYKDNEQSQEQELCTSDGYNFKGNWKEWKQGTKFIFFYPTSLGRNGYVSLKNQLLSPDNTFLYALKGSCSTVGVARVNEATLRPLGAVLRVRLNEDRKISINARTAEGRFVVGIDSTGTAVLAPTGATAAECAFLETERRSEYCVAVPAGIKLSFYDGETKLKTTRDSGFTPGTWATLTIGEEVVAQVTTLPPTDVSTYDVILHGKVSCDKIEDISRVWFVCSTNRDLFFKPYFGSHYGKNATLEPDGTFSLKCGTSSDKTHYYAAFAEGKSGLIQGDILSFTTPPFSPKYTFEDPRISPHFTSASICNNLKTDDPYVQTSYIDHSLYSDTYSTRDEIIQNGKRAFNYTITGLERGTTYYYVPVINIRSTYNENIKVYGDVYSFTTLSSDAEIGEAVDLGLSVNWRSCNIGADSPTDPGETYSWGETSEPLSGDNCKKKYNNEEGGKRVLDLEDDTAHYRLGGKWRMPTYEEFEELKANCTLTYDSKNGIIARSNVPGHTDKSIILGIGTFWSSTLWTAFYQQAFYITFNNDTPPYHAMIDIYSYKHRIRPVCDKED